MMRILQTAIHSSIMLVLFFSLSFIYQACSDKNKKVDEQLEQKLEEVADTYTDDDYFEDSDEVTTSQGEDIDYSNDRESYSEDPVNNYSTISEENNSEAQPSRSTTTTGEYMVIAGNYLLESNADEMVSKLRKSGFSGAQKVVFDLSQYYTVIAGAYDSNTTARNTSASLTNKGIENYVLRRKR